jgi:uncharacterized protein YbcV (DUF1398 family)
MSDAIENLISAQQRAMAGRPRVGGFPYPFDRNALIAALRTDQAGESTFPEFLTASWKAGVVSYNVDFIARTVTYCGSSGESYVGSYPAAKL